MFSRTIAALNPALSLIPITSSAVMNTMIRAAGRLNHAWATSPEPSVTVLR